MQFLVCIAGFPQQVVEEIQKRPPAKFTEANDNPPLVRPINPPFAFRAGMSDSYLSDLRGRVSKLPRRGEAAIVLLYANYPGQGTANFVERFKPFALVRSIEPFYPDVAPRHERRSALKSFVDKIEDAVIDLRKRARTVRDALSGQNFTPLLLPVRNFQSPVLGQEIDRLFAHLGTEPNPRALLKTATEIIQREHPLRRQNPESGKKPEKWFEDGRGLRFKSPGSNRHGFAQEGEGHKSECLISGRVRLGAPFDALFHYDCSYERSRLDRDYPNCHEQATAPAKETHVNIAPNDYIR